ncbi:GtrA family protein [Nitratifractor salsuginis]|uniref:GtrA family protein n=1 Tax=Nitratifractor salsuginis (strain DSM 16511 / JCM 12458 / E9I37-1) TaxID=749222 RepID=E6X2Z7_NITSE|nr:GtrA family protein [Nitratifractor salsuginis]ADV47280.1 GtrA family protein [Nitratifractor salsuginis DSM 16511]
MMRRLLFDKQFHRFIAVGVLNTAVGYGLFAFFIFLGLHYALASLLATILGILFNFHTIGKIVFGCHDYRLMVRFFAVYGITYLLSIAFLAVFDFLGVNMYLAGALLLAPMAVISFLLNKYFVFWKKK